MVSWVLKEAMGLGKKILISGIVISSAPLFLPPLVVVSALGFAFLVPAGLAFASYACTDTLMSKLLPMPAPSPMVEHGTMFSNEGEEEEKGFGGEIGMQENKQEGMIDKEGYEEDGGVHEEGQNDEPLGELDVEIEGETEEVERELTIEENKKPFEGLKANIEDVKEEEEREEPIEENKEPMEGVNVKIEGLREEGEKEPQIKENKEILERFDMKIEVGSEGGGNTSMEENKEPLEREVVEFEGVRETEATMDKNKTEQTSTEMCHVVIEGNEENGGNVNKMKGSILVARRVKGEIGDGEKMIGNEDEESKIETTGLLQTIGDEGNAAKQSYHNVEEKDEKIILSTEEIEKPFEKDNEKVEKVVQSTKQTGGGERNVDLSVSTYEARTHLK